MKSTRYTGTFKYEHNGTLHEYDLTVNCFGFIQAFFQLTSMAIGKGRTYQLHRIVDDYGEVRMVNDIHEMNIFKN